MSPFKGFERTISFAPGGAEGKWTAGLLAQFARDELAAAIQRGEATRRHLRAVNGRIDAPEESVEAPGRIVYSFDWVVQAVITALRGFEVVVPRRSGAYAKGFIVVSQGQEVAPMALRSLKLGAPALIVNTKPYSRKIQVGAKGFETYRGTFDVVARRVRSEYPGLVTVSVRFVSLSGAYRLKYSQGRRRDRQAGSELSYPALEIVSETIVAN